MNTEKLHNIAKKAFKISVPVVSAVLVATDLTRLFQGESTPFLADNIEDLNKVDLQSILPLEGAVLSTSAVFWLHKQTAQIKKALNTTALLAHTTNISSNAIALALEMENNGTEDHVSNLIKIGAVGTSLAGFAYHMYKNEFPDPDKDLLP